LPLQKHLRRMMEALAEGQKRHAHWKEMWERQHAEEMERWAQRHAEGVEKGVEQWAQGVEKWAERHAEGVEKWARGVEKWAEQAGSWGEHLEKKERRKWERRMARERLREEQRARKRQRELEEANPLMGWVFALAALVMAGMAVINVQLWWLIFVALGMGAASAGILGRVHQLRRLQEGQRQGTGEAAPEAPGRAEAPRQAEDPRTARVDGLCDKLLAEFRAGPGVLREVVHQPEQTVEGLRKSCHELARRERELRALSPPEEERRLEEERARLAARVEAERDGVVKERLEGALRLLDEQRKQRAELATAASRLEAEHMRLYYTLENLYTQVLRVRSADAAGADVAGAGLRRSVEQLGLEMDAVAEALEEVHRDAPPPERVPTR
jgi:hypothetical protein